MNKYLYTTAKSEPDIELIRAECYALTNKSAGFSDENWIAISNQLVDVSRGAYVKKCIEIMLEADDMDELLAKVEDASLFKEGFRVSVIKRTEDSELSSMAICRKVGALIGGKPNLDHPALTFFVVVTSTKLFFGKLISESDVAWRAHSQKPYLNSSSLSARLARTVVNLVAKPSDSLIDPCCGMGTIITEAAHMGIEVTGYDIKKKMVVLAKRNFDYFGLKGRIECRDAREVSGKYDALVTDFPYGINTQANPQLYRDILHNAKLLASKIAVVAADDITHLFQELSIEVKQIIPAYKPNFTRYIHIAEM